MRTSAIIGLSLICYTWAVSAQTGFTNPAPSSTNKPAPTPIPEFLAYRHFLGWVIELNSRALSAGATDPYKFADPFQRAGLSPKDLDAILREAKSLDSDLTRKARS